MDNQQLNQIKGNYANLAIITHFHAEFLIDFVNAMPGSPKSKVRSKIVFYTVARQAFHESFN